MSEFAIFPCTYPQPLSGPLDTDRVCQIPVKISQGINRFTERQFVFYSTELFFLKITDIKIEITNKIKITANEVPTGIL